MNRKLIFGIPCLLLMGNVLAQTAANMPAARAHVRVVNGTALKYTSKLANVVELNFTFNFHHIDGKPIITQSLERVAKSYAIDGKDAFTLKKVTSGTGGTEKVAPPFTLTDLLASEVIVANNISSFNSTSLGNDKRAAIETAIKTNGRGYLGFHGSGDGGTGWTFYTSDLHPVDYKSHGARTPGTVYKHQALQKHIILQNILETGTTLANVPNGTDASGQEIIATGVKSRRMVNEWYKFGRNLVTDATYKTRVTPLLKYDPRDLGAALEPLYRYPGGNLYTFLLQVGQGKASYIPAGHEADELTLPGTTFDGGTGDLDRYLAQTLFYLAGYKTEVCAGTACNGLPIVDAATEQLTGQNYTGSTALFDPNRMAFTSYFDEKYEAKILDVAGRVVATKSGFGKVNQEFDMSRMKPGIYFMKVKIGKAAPATHRYAYSPSSR